MEYRINEPHRGGGLFCRSVTGKEAATRGGRPGTKCFDAHPLSNIRNRRKTNAGRLPVRCREATIARIAEGAKLR